MAGRAVMLACVTTVSLVLALSPLRMVASAQTAAAEGGRQANPDFDAVVVREWKSGQRPKRYFSDARRQDPGRVLAQYSALSALVRYAFDLHASDPIENLPNWAGPPGADFGPGVVIESRVI
ncbi:MAG TPA: hypothetical protein VN515_10445 [Terriglobales bacterium]|nr:hypothetical protein [Terriglobales bacterium]